MNSTPVVSLAAILSLGLTACSGRGADSEAVLPTSAEIEDVLDTQWQTYIDGAMTEDIQRALSVWAPDMRLLSDPGGTEEIVGRDGYRALMEAAFPTLSVVDLSSDRGELLVLDSAHVLESGLWTEVYAFEQPIDTVTFYGAFQALWTKQPDGVWRIHRFIRNRHDFLSAGDQGVGDGA